MHLSDIKIVDLNRSVIDKEQSDPKKGEYVFKKKVYVEQGDYLNQDHRPPWKFRKERWNPPNFREVSKTKIALKGSFLTTKDPYWPEGVPPNAEGKYVFDDIVWMKVPLEVWLEKKVEDSNRAERASKKSAEDFANLARQKGVEPIDAMTEVVYGKRGR